MSKTMQAPSVPEGCRMVYLSEKPPIEEPGMLADYPELLTVQHIATITGVSEQTIRREINDGNLPGCKIGRRMFVPKEAFIEYATGGSCSERV